MGSKDVTLAYDDDTKETIGSKDVTLAYDDYAKGISILTIGCMIP